MGWLTNSEMAPVYLMRALLALPSSRSSSTLSKTVSTSSASWSSSWSLCSVLLNLASGEVLGTSEGAAGSVANNQTKMYNLEPPGQGFSTQAPPWQLALCARVRAPPHARGAALGAAGHRQDRERGGAGH